MAGLAIWLLLILTILYEVYFLYQVRIKINSQEPPDHPVHVIKVDDSALSKAAQRFNAANNYTFTETNIPDPFALQIKLLGPGNGQ